MSKAGASFRRPAGRGRAVPGMFRVNYVELLHRGLALFIYRWLTL